MPTSTSTPLTPDEFRARFGTIFAVSINGFGHVCSALTASEYIWWSTPHKRYIRERRNA